MKTSEIAKMAWRNLWRSKRRTAITLMGISFGVMLSIMFTGMQDSVWGNVIDMAARLGSGHVTVQHKGVLERPSLKKTVPAASGIVKALEDNLLVDRAVGRISGQAMMATATASYGVVFFAVDPAVESPDTLSLLDGDVEGALLDEADDEGAVLGKVLARNLNVRLGSKVVYTMTDKSGEIVSGLARVKGILDTGSDAMDASLCLLGISPVRALLGYDGDEVTQVSVFLRDPRDSRAASVILNQALGNPTLDVLPWQVINPDLDGMITMKMESSNILSVLIMLLVTAGIFNTLLVSVMERFREFGIMRAIGFNRHNLFALVMWESLFVGCCGLLAAAAITAWPYYYMNTVGIDMAQLAGTGKMTVNGMGMNMFLTVDIYPHKALIIAVGAVLATMASGLYPAWRAGRVVPVESIKLV